MQTRTKSALLLLAVLALGILIGILASGLIVNRRLDRIARMRTGPGIAFFIEDVVQPETVEQREQIRAVMDGAAPRFAEIFQRTREEMDALTDSVTRELSAVLSDEQLRRLRDHLETRRPRTPRHGREGERRRGRPPPDSADGGPAERRSPERPPREGS